LATQNASYFAKLAESILFRIEENIVIELDTFVEPEAEIPTSTRVTATL